MKYENNLTSILTNDKKRIIKNFDATNNNIM